MNLPVFEIFRGEGAYNASALNRVTRLGMPASVKI
jgi:hypothetical protein